MFLWWIFVVISMMMNGLPSSLNYSYHFFGMILEQFLEFLDIVVQEQVDIATMNIDFIIGLANLNHEENEFKNDMVFS